MELLILVKGKGIEKPGDVIAVHQENDRWGRAEVKNPNWRVIRVVDRPLYQTHVTALLSSQEPETFHGAEHFRLWAIDLTKLAPGRDQFAMAVEDASFQREITGVVPEPPVEISRAAGLLAMVPFQRKGETRRFTRRTLFRVIAAIAAFLLLRREAMAGTVTKTIGSSSRDYTDIQAFVTALPANLVTDGNSYVGECYNDSEFTGTGTLVTFSALTTDSTHTVTVTAAAGQSYRDNASVRTNALKYNVSNGVGVRKTDDYSNLFLMSGVVNYLTISRLQLSKSATGPGSSIYHDTAGGANLVLRDLICEHLGNSGTGIFVSGGALLVNVLFIARSSNAITAFGQGNAGGNATFIACGAVRPSDFTAGGTGFNRSYGSPVLTSCYSFGFTTASSSGFGAGSSNNATEQSSIAGSSNQTSMTYNSSTPFTNAADSTRDFRSIASTSLVANGLLDATNAPNDISGTARPSNSDIGVWQVASSSPTVVQRRHD